MIFAEECVLRPTENKVSQHFGRSALVLVLMLGAAASLNAEQDKDVLAMLQGYEWEIPRGALAARQNLNHLRASLLDIARDEAQVNFIRARAATMLSEIPNDEVFAFFRQEISAGSDPIRRRQQVDNLCRAFAHSEAAAIEELLIPLLDGGDTHLSGRAARCLNQQDPPASDPSAQQHTVDETAAREIIGGISQ